MKLIYNINWKRLIETDSGRSIDLTKLEWKFIECILHGDIVTWDEILDYVYKGRDTYRDLDNIKVVRYRLSKKIKLNIATKNKVGIKLKDEILIDYV